MKILLLSPPYLSDYMRNGRCDYISWSHTQWYPIWLAYCGALLEKYGHKVRLIDAPAAGLGYKDIFKRIINFIPDIIVIYSSTKSQDSDIRFSEEIKDNLGSYIVFVGPYVSADVDLIFETSKKVDAVVKGEFDYAVLELADSVKKTDIKNLIWRDNGQIVSNELRAPLVKEELDRIPFVTDFYQRHLNLRDYRVPSELYPFVDIFTGRGCIWGRCAFCLWPHSFIKKGCYNTRSIENVVEEIKFVNNKMPYVKEVFIQDDTLPRDRAIELSRAILDNNLNVTWSCYSRGDLDYDTLRLMKDSGCSVLHVGYESKSNLILKKIDKGLTFERMTEFTYDAHRLGLKIHGDFLLGLPGETEKTIKETIEWARLLDPETAQFLIPIPYKATPFFNYLKMRNQRLDLEEKVLHKWQKIAYRSFYMRWKFIKKASLRPDEYIFSRIRPILRMIENMFL
jgi:radical SAM superfamily enzyme YgiQ (UPF0313 family)